MWIQMAVQMDILQAVRTTQDEGEKLVEGCNLSEQTFAYSIIDYGNFLQNSGHSFREIREAGNK